MSVVHIKVELPYNPELISAGIIHAQMLYGLEIIESQYQILCVKNNCYNTDLKTILTRFYPGIEYCSGSTVFIGVYYKAVILPVNGSILTEIPQKNDAYNIFSTTIKTSFEKISNDLNIENNHQFIIIY
jgi:hypothetical protein